MDRLRPTKPSDVADPKRRIRLGFNPGQRAKLNPAERRHVAVRILGYALFPGDDTGLSSERDQYFAQLLAERLWLLLEGGKLGPVPTKRLAKAERVLHRRSGGPKRPKNDQNADFYENGLLERFGQRLRTVAAVARELLDAAAAAGASPAVAAPGSENDDIQPAQTTKRLPSLNSAVKAIRNSPEKKSYISQRKPILLVWKQYRASAHLVATIVPLMDKSGSTKLSDLINAMASDLPGFFRAARRLQRVLPTIKPPKTKEPVVIRALQWRLNRWAPKKLQASRPPPRARRR